MLCQLNYRRAERGGLEPPTVFTFPHFTSPLRVLRDNALPIELPPHRRCRERTRAATRMYIYYADIHSLHTVFNVVLRPRSVFIAQPGVSRSLKATHPNYLALTPRAGVEPATHCFRASWFWWLRFQLATRLIASRRRSNQFQHD